jgi:hypothetical protein
MRIARPPSFIIHGTEAFDQAAVIHGDRRDEANPRHRRDPLSVAAMASCCRGMKKDHPENGQMTLWSI